MDSPNFKLRGTRLRRATTPALGVGHMAPPADMFGKVGTLAATQQWSPQSTDAAPRPSGPSAVQNSAAAGEIANPMRKLGVNMLLILLFIRMTELHEVIGSQFGTNLSMLYWFAIPTLVCLVLSGGLGRAFKYRPVMYWAGFAFWLAAAVPFSGWIGQSFTVVSTYIRTDWIILLMITGLVMTMEECWRICNTMAASAVGAALIGYFYPANLGSDRVQLSIDISMADPNDYGALLILLLPFLGLKIFQRNWVIGVPAAGFFLYSLYFILSTGSRGALVALIVAILFVFWHVSVERKIFLTVAVTVIAAVLGLALPSQTVARLSTVFFSPAASTYDLSVAEASAESRMYLLRQSLIFTATHPLFGVGPGEFADQEGIKARQSGSRGAWHETHNAYTQVSSEAGIPALIFLIAAMVSSFRIVKTTYRLSKLQPQTLLNKRVTAVCFAVLMSLVGFYSCIFFLSLGYRVYLPALTGIALVVCQAAQRQWKNES